MNYKNLKFVSTGTLFFAHMLNDMYINFLPLLTSILISAKKISVSEGSLIVAMFTISASIAQPVFGYLIDQRGQSWFIYAGSLWMALLLSLTGYISSTFLLMFVAAAAGIGTAAFHPQAAEMVSMISEKNKSLIMSSFIAMGNMGIAISPLLLLPLFHNYGVAYTWVAVFPGMLAAFLLYFFAPTPYAPAKEEPQSRIQLREYFDKTSSEELVKILIIVALRSMVYTGLLTLLPLYFLSKQFPIELAGYLMFTMLTAGSIGGIIGGYISDHFGKKILIAGSMLLASASYYGFLAFPNPLSYVFLSLGGMSLLSTFSVTVVMAQELIPQNAALASGLSMGFAVGIGGFGVSLAGHYAELFGIDAAIKMLFFIPVIASIVAIFLRRGPALKWAFKWKSTK